jgi:hypothetical protein
LLTKEIFVVLFVAECALVERNKLEKFMSQLKSFLDVSWIEKNSVVNCNVYDSMLDALYTLFKCGKSQIFENILTSDSLV